MLPAAPAAAGTTAVAAASRQQVRRSSSVSPSSVATSAAAAASMLASRATVSAASPASAPAALPCTHRSAGHSQQTASASECWGESSTNAFPPIGAAVHWPCWQAGDSSQRSPHLKVLHAARHISSVARQLGKLGRHLPQPLPRLHRWRLYVDCWRRVERAPAGVEGGGSSGVQVRGMQLQTCGQARRYDSSPNIHSSSAQSSSAPTWQGLLLLRQELFLILPGIFPVHWPAAHAALALEKVGVRVQVAATGGATAARQRWAAAPAAPAPPAHTAHRTASVSVRSMQQSESEFSSAGSAQHNSRLQGGSSRQHAHPLPRPRPTSHPRRQHPRRPSPHLHPPPPTPLPAAPRQLVAALLLVALSLLWVRVPGPLPLRLQLDHRPFPLPLLLQ